MSEIFAVADTHFDHANCIIHDNRPYIRDGDLDSRKKWVSEAIKQARCDEMNADMAKTWNDTISKDDTVIIVGDFAWHNHRKWINELNGKKIMIIGSHDKMPHDALELFVPDWENPLEMKPAETPEDVWLAEEEERLSWINTIKTLHQFREVHWLLNREVNKQYICFCHWPMRTWQGKPHGSWAISGHCHGRLKESLPNESGGGLLLDVGWAVWKRPVHFEEIRSEMKRKLYMLKGKYYSESEIIN